jgi:hypothetical protein
MEDISASILAIVVCQLFLESISLCLNDTGEGILPFIHSIYLLEHFILVEVVGPSEAHITFIAFCIHETKIALLTFFGYVSLCL